MSQRKIVLASNNAGKVKEFNALFTPLGIEVIPQGVLGIPSCEEPFPTFIENAIAKARHASKLSGLPALADDSGICVDALGGHPGVLSARFALSDQKRDPSDADNNALLVQQLLGCTRRQAHFTCTLVFLNSEIDPEPLIALGHWQGEILETPKGSSGFGYDPLFWVPELKKTAAEMSAEEKNQISHRGQALQKLLAQLPKKLS
ncbi:RdgB/HAM1 family non-canonical purine NTP pyrophosphatase [Polynucleobacter sp. 30F-ANTBAC]|uniref:RdgB/HAM1 family non-canonical purine NTP pyrophosphatase n=1 Tax=Polynucleobacter sp. 30F-ANTBAC TaxID=2689095 RepID=UPI001C0D3DDD|nr:RdgB/HAM1 family non-canonical purine NTP pyrophosphatase [Polynucleobacter sp. 30F-ANTBAC]MBU3600519.1 RdgB/HAM1 family non-canonical purine NTP pyrophosphatase [Polynucleobacter sp. 30F-ANTBAC]